MLDKKWAKAAMIRAVRTFCQAALGLMSTAVFLSDVNWIQVASASALAAIFSILTSVAGLPEVDETVK